MGRMRLNQTRRFLSDVRIFRMLLVAAVSGCLLPAAPVLAGDWYVAANGTSGNAGTAASPWDLKTALNGGNAGIKPGDTVWLKGGRYDLGYDKSTYNNLEGAPGKPITIRQMPRERATIMGTLYQENQGWIVYRDFEIMHSYTHRMSAQTGSDPADRPNRSLVALYAPNNKFINLVFHDSLSNGIYVSELAPNTEVYGCLFYNNGWMAPDRGHGHGLYSKNNVGHNRYADNILCNGFSHGLHLYDEHLDAIQHYLVEGNVAFNSGMNAEDAPGRNLLIGGEAGVTVKSSTIRNNCLYYPEGVTADTFNLGAWAGSAQNTVTGNYFAGGCTRIAAPCKNLTFSDNLIYSKPEGFSAAKFPANSYLTARPADNRILLRPNEYDPSRVTIIIYNWQKQTEVAVPLPAGFLTKGESYEVRNVQDYFQDIVTGVGDGGGSIRISMAGHTTAAPLGWKAAPSTFPEFGVFVVMKTGYAAPVAPSP